MESVEGFESVVTSHSELPTFFKVASEFAKKNIKKSPQPSERTGKGNGAGSRSRPQTRR